MLCPCRTNILTRQASCEDCTAKPSRWLASRPLFLGFDFEGFTNRSGDRARTTQSSPCRVRGCWPRGRSTGHASRLPDKRTARAGDEHSEPRALACCEGHRPRPPNHSSHESCRGTLLVSLPPGRARSGPLANMWRHDSKRMTRSRRPWRARS